MGTEIFYTKRNNSNRENMEFTVTEWRCSHKLPQAEDYLNADLPLD